jgi:hypothetical protein
MDMSSFHPMGRNRGVNRRPDFESLRAAMVARQALLPTTLAMALLRHHDTATAEGALGTLTLFQPEIARMASVSPASSSFHAGVAARLLTREQGV